MYRGGEMREKIMTQNNWWREGVIYQIYPRSYFSASDTQTGDLAGIRSKLDYIAALGHAAQIGSCCGCKS